MGMLKNFFSKSIENNIYPFGTKECAAYLKEAYKNSIDETLLLKEELYEKILKYDEINNNIKALEFEKKYIEHFLQNEMKEYETAFCKERKITWKTTEKTILDSKLIKQNEPELASRYSKTSKSRLFKIY